MERHLSAMECTGTRDELISELDDSARGWAAFAKDDNAADCRAGIERLREGADQVTVGHTVYRVTDVT